jgi:germination protein M
MVDELFRHRKNCLMARSKSCHRLHVLKLNLSKELLDVNENQEEKIIEAIVYTLTSVEGIDKIILYVEGDILTKLPKSKINLPSTLDRSFGINKEYDITQPKDINQVTIYYVSKFNDNYYYVPVTKYLNDDREKIKIVIDELTSSTNYNSNLMSFLDNNTKLITVNNSNSIMELEFNNSILNNLNTNEILEEVIYTISLSIDDNYEVDEVVFLVDEEQIYKSVLKEID